MRRVVTKNKTMTKFITLEDREGLVEAVLFEKAYKQFWHLFRGYGPYVVKGRVQSRLFPTSRDLHFVPTGEANCSVKSGKPGQKIGNRRCLSGIFGGARCGFADGLV